MAVYALVDAPAQWWYSHVIEQLLPLMKQAGMEIPDQAAFEADMRDASRIMTGTLAAIISFGLAVSLLIGDYCFAGGTGLDYQRRVCRDDVKPVNCGAGAVHVSGIGARPRGSQAVW